MKRAQVYFHDERVYEAVRTKAFQQRTSISALLEQWAREKTLATSKKQPPAAGLLDDLVGLIHETKPDVAERHDDYLWGAEA